MTSSLLITLSSLADLWERAWQIERQERASSLSQEPLPTPTTAKHTLPEMLFVLLSIKSSRISWDRGCLSGTELPSLFVLLFPEARCKSQNKERWHSSPTHQGTQKTLLAQESLELCYWMPTSPFIPPSPAVKPLWILLSPSLKMHFQILAGKIDPNYYKH